MIRVDVLSHLNNFDQTYFARFQPSYLILCASNACLKTEVPNQVDQVMLSITSLYTTYNFLFATLRFNIFSNIILCGLIFMFKAPINIKDTIVCWLVHNTQ